MQNIGVLGTGTWGTALLRLLANKGHAVTAWSALPEEVEALASTRGTAEIAASRRAPWSGN